MLSSNQIARLFDDQYLWKEWINILDFLHGDTHHRKVATEKFGWALPDVVSHAQTCLDLLDLL